MSWLILFLLFFAMIGAVYTQFTYGTIGLASGMHVYNRRKDYPLNSSAIGANFRFSLPPTSFINKVVNNLNLMAEYDSKSIILAWNTVFGKTTSTP